MILQRNCSLFHSHTHTHTRTHTHTHTVFPRHTERGGSIILPSPCQSLLSGRTQILLPGDAARRRPVDLPSRKQVHRNWDAAFRLPGRAGSGGWVRFRRENVYPDSSSVRSRRHRRLSGSAGRCSACCRSSSPAVRERGGAEG